MRKNRMMRLASALLILTMVTTCAISGTFAKYVTESKATDTARVAKWGMTVEVVGNLFGANYNAKTNEGGNDISALATGSVDSSDTDNIVAPGTKSDKKGMTLAVKGTPEVDYTVEYANVDEFVNKTIWLKTGYYAMLVETTEVTADNFKGYYYKSGSSYKLAAGTETFADLGTEWYKIHDTVDVTANSTGTYNPVEWTVKDNKAGTTAKYREVDAMAAALKTHFDVAAANSQVNTLIDKSCTITWEWAFADQQDGADTVLGNLMAVGTEYVVVKSAASTYDVCNPLVADDGDGVKEDGEDYNLYIGFGAKITATQVD